MSEYLTRTLTGMFMLVLLALLFYFGTNIAFNITIYTISLVAYLEWLRLTSKSIIFFFPFFVLLIFLHYFLIINLTIFSYVCILLWLLLAIYLFFFKKFLQHFIEKHSLLIGTLIISSFFTFLINLYPSSNTIIIDNELIDNKSYFLILILMVTSVDVYAYICGKAIGKNKIGSDISPNKTFEGYIGSLFLTFFTFYFISAYLNFNWTSLDLIIMLIFILMTFFGDLFMSFIKRTYKKKDTGSILPGHGGILDRLDSYFSALPVFFVWFLS